MWEPAETNTHQDHVIAHVIGASVLGYFVWDETAYLLLDIGFIWNIYLDAEMGFMPQVVALAELKMDEDHRSWVRVDGPTVSQSADLLQSEDRQRPVLTW